jgi:arylsulfatase A-like enzyme
MIGHQKATERKKEHHAQLPGIAQGKKRTAGACMRKKHDHAGKATHSVHLWQDAAGFGKAVRIRAKSHCVFRWVHYQSTMRISRRQFILGGALTAAAASLYPVLGRFAKPRPNFVFVLADDLRWDAVGVNKRTFLVKSRLDDIRDECLHARNSFVTTSICPTSRASIALGQHALRHRIWGFGKSFSEEQFQSSLPALLKESGYRTGFIDKWGVGKNFYRERFDFFRGGQSRSSYATRANRHLTDLDTLWAIQFLDNFAYDSSPFFLQISYKAPHTPFTPQREFADLYREITSVRTDSDTQRDYEALPDILKKSYARKLYLRMQQPAYDETIRNYYRLCAGLEASIASVVDHLKKLGVYDNTYIVISSDNGLMLGERGLLGKECMYEESIRVPLIIKPARDGQMQPGIFDGIALNIDIAPTILALAGSKIPDAMQGVSLVGHKSGKPWRQSFLYHQKLSRAERGDPPSQCVGVRTDTWKYSRYSTSELQEELLFRIDSDPGEKQNLAAVPEHVDRLAELRAQTENYLRRLA